MLILAIDTSCDETAVAVTCGRRIISNVIYSQSLLHKKWGGVVPSLAKRAHEERIDWVVDESLKKAKTTMEKIDSISVTYGPGLAIALEVGIKKAKKLSVEYNKKVIAVNHMEGHIYSCFGQNRNGNPKLNFNFPYLALLISGGHTELVLFKNHICYEILGSTIDDAAGEAFDKVAKLLQLPYPGGPVIEQLAGTVDFYDFFKYPRSKKVTPDFSFSGLKTAVLYDLVKRGAYDLTLQRLLPIATLDFKAQVASSLLTCISDIFKDKLSVACKLYPEVRAVTFVGGVSCNQFLRDELKKWADKRDLLFVVPPKCYTTDNAAMVAFVANYKAQQGKFSDLSLDIGVD